MTLLKTVLLRQLRRGPALSQRILLVDDEPAILFTMKAILEVNGFDVVTAASCAEAKLRLAANSYHLVITDLNMEKETSGLDVLRYAREQHYRPAVAILTAYPDLASDWKEQGADGLFVKPTNMPELLERIGALLARQQIATRRKTKTVGESVQVHSDNAAAATSPVQFAAGSRVPQTGIYIFQHTCSRSPQEVVATRGSGLLACPECVGGGTYLLVRAAPLPDEDPDLQNVEDRQTGS